MKNFKWEHVWHGIGALLVLLVAAVLTVNVFAQKDVDYYYIQRGEGPTICANAHWTWHTDSTAFCSDDYNKVLDFTQRANALRGK